jgi:glyoxylase-like metal-dependent hydrolase (beta-lactamase superfamily II)/rhodanese-related sulfurtransferase
MPQAAEFFRKEVDIQTSVKERSPVILKQYYLACLSHASYLVADEGTKVAAIIDPQRDIDQYLADAEARGLTIRHVLLTHFHADFVAGHVELRDRTGASIHLGVRAQAEFPFEPMRDGGILSLGKVKLHFLETPGHTPEGISILVYDNMRDALRPQAVFTGDTLFIGDVGRPDLMASVGLRAEDLAGMLYDSLHDKLMKLPDDTLVYPAHGAGSACGKNMSKETVSTIGAQRAHNYAVQPMTKAAFVKMATSELPEAPAYFSHDARQNRLLHTTLEKTLERALKPLTLDQVLAEQADHAIVLDVRDPDAYAPAHLEGSINIGLGGRFASWVGTLLDPKLPIVIIAPVGKEAEAALRLGRVGFDEVAGYLEGGFDAVRARPQLVRTIQRLQPEAFAQQLASEEPPLVLDVRNPGEWNEAHLQGSLLIPLNHLEAHLRDLPRERKIAIHCASGYRSSIAASMLERHGLVGVTDMTGGIQAWQSAGHPIERPEPVKPPKP